MSFIVTGKCICCKYTNCIEVCPVNCFHEGENFVVINPEICIDCALCEAECPAEAIVSDYNITNNEKKFIVLNKNLSKIWPIIKNKKPPQPNAENWKKIKEKLKYLKK